MCQQRAATATRSKRFVQVLVSASAANDKRAAKTLDFDEHVRDPRVNLLAGRQRDQLVVLPGPKQS